MLSTSKIIECVSVRVIATILTVWAHSNHCCDDKAANILMKKREKNEHETRVREEKKNNTVTIYNIECVLVISEWYRSCCCLFSIIQFDLRPEHQFWHIQHEMLFINVHPKVSQGAMLSVSVCVRERGSRNGIEQPNEITNPQIVNCWISGAIGKLLIFRIFVYYMCVRIRAERHRARRCV